MNEAMRLAWLEISQMLGEPTREELDVFLRTWQRAIQAEREACAKEFDRRAAYVDGSPSSGWYEPEEPAQIIRARGETK